MEKFENVYEDWKSSPDVDKFYDYDEYCEGKKYLLNFYKEIESVLELVPENLYLSEEPELSECEARFQWYFDGKMLDILIESGEKYVVASREPSNMSGDFLYGDPFDGFYEIRLELENKKRIKELFTWLLEE